VIVLGENQYGKAENRLVRIYRDSPRHEIRDLNVSTSLRGTFEAAHLRGDQSAVLPTDTQKNTVFAFAKEKGVGAIEEFALTLARHFVDDVEPVTGARVAIEEYAWDRVEVNGQPHDHTFVRRGQEIRTALVKLDGDGLEVMSGLTELTVLKSTGSEFHGFLEDTPRTTDAWDTSYDQVRRLLLSRYASVHSLALQQTLWEMGKAVLEAQPNITEVRLSAPNRHHFAVDLSPFGLDNPGEVFYAADRPYGLIEVAVARD
jgi:urate oxidase